jgi:hypothetical protein
MLRLVATFLLFALLSLPAGAVAAESKDVYPSAYATDPKFQPKGARLTLGVALHLAEAFARQGDISSTDYEDPQFTYTCGRREWCGWTFAYRGKVISLTRVIFVHDRTKRVEFLPRMVEVK